MFELKNVVKSYVGRGCSVEALQVPGLEIHTGEYVAIVGASGSGKTTLLSVLGGMLSPTSGQVWLDGVALYGRTPAQRASLRRDYIGFVFQTFNLIPYLNAVENVQLPLCLSALSPKEQQERAVELLEQVGLGQRLRHKPHELSVGQQQRVALARTLANNPRVILADEPTGNLDPESRTLVLSFLDNLHQEGRTIVMVTHDAVVAGRAGRRLTLNQGTIQGKETMESVARAA